MSVSFCVCRRLWLLAFQTAMKSVQVHLVLNVMLSSCMNRSPSYAHLEIFAWLEEKIWVPSSVPRVMKSLAACVRLCSHRVSYKISASENPLTARWTSAVIGWDRKGAEASIVPAWPSGVYEDGGVSAAHEIRTDMPPRHPKVYITQTSQESPNALPQLLHMDAHQNSPLYPLLCTHALLISFNTEMFSLKNIYRSRKSA